MLSPSGFSPQDLQGHVQVVDVGLWVPDAQRSFAQEGQGAADVLGVRRMKKRNHDYNAQRKHSRKYCISSHSHI